MVGVAAEDRAIPPPFSCSRGLRVESDAYVAMCRDFHHPFMDAQRPGGFWSEQDGASAHTSEQSTAELGNLFKKKALQNPPSSPDLCVVDCHLWDHLDKLVQSKEPKTTQELESCIAQAWPEVDREEVSRAIGSWPRRLAKCIEKEGDRFGHIL